MKRLEIELVRRWICVGLIHASLTIVGMVGVLAVEAKDSTQPNILWITSEDNGPQLGCYGDAYAVTPHIDELASRSLRYQRCWSNAPVCAAARTTLIAGMYAPSLGGEHMRSGVSLPAEIQLYPQVLRDLGYYCTNNNKTDYNFANDDAGWNENSRKAHWKNRPDANQPFFAVFNFTISHESQIINQHKLVHDPAGVRVPAYHPDTPEVRRDWAQYYDRLTEMDAQVGGMLQQLEADGLADSTVVFYYGDHGSGMPRSKRWPFNSGLHVPLIVHVPERFASLAPADYQAGGESTRLVSFVDFAPTVISLAGAEPPSHMQGHAFAGAHSTEPQPYIFGFRGRMDERYDMVRSCTDGRFVYMKHFYPDKPYGKNVETMFKTPTTRIWKEMFDAGQLNPAQAKFWQTKPGEELFDLQSDPDEVVNLADRPEYQPQTESMRRALKSWMIEIADAGLLPEAEMHRRCGDVPPRVVMTSDKMPLQQVVDAAWMCTSTDALADLESVVNTSQNADPAIAYWGARGLAICAASTKDRDSVRAALVECLESPSPSVQVAACDGLLNFASKHETEIAIDRLLQLANVNHVGHFAAIEALNVLDLHTDRMSADQISVTKKLPRQVDNPPPRMGKYVGRLLDHVLNQ